VKTGGKRLRRFGINKAESRGDKLSTDQYRALQRLEN
jgi:hypothetical protein